MINLENNFLNGLSIGYWNVNGLFRKNENYCKMSDPLFLKQIDKLDIIALSETHCGDDDIVTLDGYNVEMSIRPKLSKARKHSGGLAILIKANLQPGIKKIKSNAGNYIWIQLNK